MSRSPSQDQFFSVWIASRKGTQSAEMLKQAFLAVLVLLVCCVALVQGLPTSSRDRCLCKRVGMLSVKMDRVATVEYHQSSGSCGREELLVTLKNSRRRCLNLNGEQGRTIKEAIMKKRNVK